MKVALVYFARNKLAYFIRNKLAYFIRNKLAYDRVEIYFNLYDPADIAKKISRACCFAIKEAVSDMKTRGKLVQKGLEQVKKYSW